MNKIHTLAEFQDLAWAAGYANEFEYAGKVGYVYEKVQRLFRRLLTPEESVRQVAVLRDMSDNLDGKGIWGHDAAGWALRAAIKELVDAWITQVVEGCPLQYLIYEDGLDTVAALKRWLTALEEAVAEKEDEHANTY